ncbi:MAG: cytochrome c, partial [Planctomycetota bacterium]|nr:cytochrome c [Planctomycetota bacterium]
DGRGPAAPFFGNAPPRNFLRGEYKFRSATTPAPPLDEDLVRAIRNGAGPSMPAWPDFSGRQVRDLVEFLKSNHPAYVPHELFVNELGGDALLAFVKGDTDVDDASGAALGDGRVVKRAGRWWWVHGEREQAVTDGLEVEAGGKRYRFRIGAAVFDWMDDFKPEPLVVPDRTIAYTRASADIGRKVYEEFGCAECHGPEGRGDGPAAAQQRGSLGQILVPADYSRGARHLKGGADAKSLVRAFLTGLHGTPMPAYAGNFVAAKSAPADDAAWHLAHFVMSQAGMPFDK